MAVLKVETDIARAAVLVRMYVETFKMDASVFIGIQRHTVTSQ